MSGVCAGPGPRLRLPLLLDSIRCLLSDRNTWLLLQNSSHNYCNSQYDGQGKTQKNTRNVSNTALRQLQIPAITFSIGLFFCPVELLYLESDHLRGHEPDGKVLQTLSPDQLLLLAVPRGRQVQPLWPNLCQEEVSHQQRQVGSGEGLYNINIFIKLDLSWSEVRDYYHSSLPAPLLLQPAPLSPA